MTGARFPIETDLVYSSSDDEEVDLPVTEVVNPNTSEPMKKEQTSEQKVIVKKSTEISVERLGASRNEEASALSR